MAVVAWHADPSEVCGMLTDIISNWLIQNSCVLEQILVISCDVKGSKVEFYYTVMLNMYIMCVLNNYILTLNLTLNLKVPLIMLFRILPVVQCVI